MLLCNLTPAQNAISIIISALPGLFWESNEIIYVKVLCKIHGAIKYKMCLYSGQDLVSHLSVLLCVFTQKVNCSCVQNNNHNNNNNNKDRS